MALSKKIENYLVKNKYKFEVVPHRTTYTAWDTAQTEKVKPQEVVKALIIKVDNDYVLALVPSNKNLDKQKLLKVINTHRKSSFAKAMADEGKKEKLKNYKKLDFAKEAWMKKNLPGKLGATPPFSELLKIPIYCDKPLTKSKKIYLGSGEYTASLRVSVAEYLKKEKPVMGSFSVAKK